MIFSKFHVGVATFVACAIAAALAWSVRGNGQLRAEAERQSRAATTRIARLEREIAVQSERAAAAETRVTALLESAKQAKAARPLATQGAGASIDTEEAAKAAVARAAQLLGEGRHKEALDVYVGCYRELQAIRPGSSECQRLMGAIKNLGRTYPEALVALAGLRDAAMAQFHAEPGRRELPFEIALLNERLGEGSRTLALYDSLPPADPGRQSLAMIANSAFIEARRYADALIGKPFGRMLTMIDAGSREISRQDASRHAAMRNAIIDGTLTNIEVLTGAGRIEDARVLTEKLLAFDNTEATRARLKQHVDRAQAPTP